MVNFRFHVVSLVAIFLALAVGVLMGSTVIDQATVDFLERNQRVLEGRIDDRDQRIDELSNEVDRWEEFADQADDELLSGRLGEVPVLVVVVEGVAGEPVERLHDWLQRTGAIDQGTITLEARLALTDDDAVEALAEAIGVDRSGGDSAGEVRQAALETLAATLSGGSPPVVDGVPAAATTVPGGPPAPNDLLAALRDADFVSFAPAPGQADQSLAVPAAESRLVVVSGAGARVPDGEMTIPLLRALTDGGTARVIAAEARDAEEGAVFISQLRDDDELWSRLSTIDNLDTFVGQVAIILALEDLASNTRGHYGVGRDARLLPIAND